MKLILLLLIRKDLNWCVGFEQMDVRVSSINERLICDVQRSCTSHKFLSE